MKPFEQKLISLLRLHSFRGKDGVPCINLALAEKLVRDSVKAFSTDIYDYWGEKI